MVISPFHTAQSRRLFWNSPIFRKNRPLSGCGKFCGKLNSCFRGFLLPVFIFPLLTRVVNSKHIPISELEHCSSRCILTCDFMPAMLVNHTFAQIWRMRVTKEYNQQKFKYTQMIQPMGT